MDSLNFFLTFFPLLPKSENFCSLTAIVLNMGAYLNLGEGQNRYSWKKVPNY
jgi:hypothetical protein